MPETLLKVKHFGPIRNAEIKFKRFTFFIGRQGSGKSTLAKLYSTFLWMEKRLVRGLDSVSYFEQHERFVERQGAYHRIESYFCDDTEIFFQGRNFTFHFVNGRLSISPVGNTLSDTTVMKVMYVPSERNFLSAIENTSDLKSLPPSLYTFKDEYDTARSHYSAGLPLSIEDVRFEFDRLHNTAWLVGNDYRVRLTDASSGFQAVTPLLLVSTYLTDLIDRQRDDRVERLSVEELERLRAEVRTIIDNGSLSNEVREAALDAVSRKYRYSGFVNIVEEPEENLFPASQRNVLYDLLSLAAYRNANELLVTTHSPYIINFLTLAVKAGEIGKMGGDMASISAIVPEKAWLDADEVAIYQLEDGEAGVLEMRNGLPSDSNKLNDSLMWANVEFDRLLDIEEEIDGK